MEAKKTKVGEMDGKKRKIGGTGEKSASAKPQTKLDISGREAHMRQEMCAGGNNTKSIKVSIDADVLDCSICFTPLRPPLFQCHNGHVTCSSCCAKLQNKCHVCLLPTGNSRCRALETLIEAMKISCPHSTLGCRETIPYIQKDTHEESCPFAPCSCPISSCTFRGPTTLLSGHLRNKHHSTPQISISYDHSFKVTLQRVEPFHVLHGEDDRIFLLLNELNFIANGNVLSIACIKPGSMESDLEYMITVKGKGSELHFKASPKNIRELKVGSPVESFLYVPRQNSVSSTVISIDVFIRKM